MHIHLGYLQPSMNLVAVMMLHTKVRNFYKLKRHGKMEILRLFSTKTVSSYANFDFQQHINLKH